MTDNNTNLIVGQNVKLLREQFGLTQEALSKYLLTSREQIAYYENGSRPISTKHLSQLSSLFCLNEYDFYEADFENQKVNVAFAFRATDLQAEDLKSISKFKKIVLNYLNMKNALVDE
jgi:transcriptional regulator with XRE-family HTH domain